MLTDKNLVLERQYLGGKQRLYRLGGFGLSLVNGPMLNSYPYAWEAAVLRFSGEGNNFTLDYSTPLSEDVEIFDTDADANTFIEKAFAYFEAQQ